jgi:hypothetical protein
MPGDGRSKRFAVNALHTNMQMWGHVRGVGSELRKPKGSATVRDEG